MLLPLEGFRIIEFCEVAAGPFCGMLLADMGADVIKVERPDGDGMRQWPPLTNGYSENFASVNRNKRSVVLNLKEPQGVEAARALIRRSDAVIENYRPGVMARHGLDYGTLAKDQPDLVYVSISAFGQTGPRSQEGGFDLTLQAIAGVMSVTGEPGGAPVKCGVPLCDFVSGLYGAFSVSCGLLKAQKSRIGDHYDVSMLGATLAVAALQTSQYFGTGVDPAKLGSAHPRNAPYQAFRGSDGWFVMAAGNNKLWKKVCEVTGLLQLYNDPRFLSSIERAQNQQVLCELLEEVFHKRPKSFWLESLGKAGVPCGEINTYSDVLSDPQVEHLGLVRFIELPVERTTRTVIAPMLLSGKNFPVRRSPPALGAHTEEVFKELGIDLRRGGS